MVAHLGPEVDAGLLESRDHGNEGGCLARRDSRAQQEESGTAATGMVGRGGERRVLLLDYKDSFVHTLGRRDLYEGYVGLQLVENAHVLADGGSGA
jgi:hypothetical protein